MAADMHIHIRTADITDEVMREFFSSTIGSVYWGGFGAAQMPYEERHKFTKPVWDAPGVWVGSVSWLKAMVFEDGDEYVPGPVGAIQELFDTPDECRYINEGFIIQVEAAYDAPNMANDYYKHDSKDKVLAFLEQHKGERCFTVSW
jgi:hypothetical protein